MTRHLTGKRSTNPLRRLALLSLATLVAAAVALSLGLPGTGAAFANSKAKSVKNASTNTVVKLVSGQGNSSGVDTNTSFCQGPLGIKTITQKTMPVNPKCAAGTPTNPDVVTTPVWTGTIAGAQWDSLNSTGSDSSNPPPAYYVYDATFNVCQVKGTSFKGQLLSDNAAGVFLNGTHVANQPDSAISGNFNNPFAFSGSSGFVVGLNTFDFVVHDITAPYTGLDYSVTISTPSCGTLKVCKVAGFGVAVGTPFKFTAGTVSVTVPAGPAPGGYCNILGTNYAVGTDVTIKEAIPAGDQVVSISVLPAAQLVSSNLNTGKVEVAIGTGVTEATYTDQTQEAAKAGYLEICKIANANSGVTPPSSFQFTVDGQPVTVPTNACTSAMQIPAGSTSVVETPAGGFSMSACSTIPASALLSCNPSGNSVTVQVNPGNTSKQTILEVTNTASSTT